LRVIDVDEEFMACVMYVAFAGWGKNMRSKLNAIVLAVCLAVS
jgi:hypothetical protein